MLMDCQVTKAENKVKLTKVLRYLFATNSFHWETILSVTNTHFIYALHERDENLKWFQKDY